MAIQTAKVGQTASTVTYSSINNNAVTFMSLCNFNSSDVVTVDIHVVPASGTASVDNLVISALNIAATDTYILYQGNEKIVLGDNDFIEVVPSGTITDPVIITAVVEGTEYRIVTLGASDNYTLIGATEFVDGTDAFIVGDEYIISDVGTTTVWTDLGAVSGTLGEVFIATDTVSIAPGGDPGAALDTIFTANAVPGVGDATAKTSVLSVMTSFMEV